MAGGCPATHRTDSLSAAYVNAAEQATLTLAYAALCEHYRMKPTRNNAGVSHENGAIECAHGSFKRRLDQALKLRGSNDFHNLDEYRRFIERLVDRLNRRCRVHFEEERKAFTSGGVKMDQTSRFEIGRYFCRDLAVEEKQNSKKILNFIMLSEQGN